jgi:hypothetical protein
MHQVIMRDLMTARTTDLHHPGRTRRTGPNPPTAPRERRRNKALSCLTRSLSPPAACSRCSCPQALASALTPGPSTDSGPP